MIWPCQPNFGLQVSMSASLTVKYIALPSMENLGSAENESNKVGDGVPKINSRKLIHKQKNKTQQKVSSNTQ